MPKLLTIKEYAKIEGVLPATIRQRALRGKLVYVYRYGKPLINPNLDLTIKKPRKNGKNS